MANTILISLFTSLAVSLITFILGLRSGKNQADRSKLQELYKNLYSHFATLEEAIQKDKPREWADYPEKSTGIYSSRYCPPVAALKDNGDALFLKKKIVDNALELEKDCLSYAWKCNTVIERCHEVISSQSDLFNESLEFEKNRNNSSDTTRCKTANPLKCNTFRYYSYLSLLSKNSFSKIITEWANNTDPYAISFITRGNPPKRSFVLYPGSLSVSPEKFVDTLTNKFINDVPQYSEVFSEKVSLSNRLRKIQKIIARRAKEPVSFWETFIGAFADIFR